MAIFLSDDWFKQVAQMIEQAGDLNLPQPLQQLKVNLLVTQDNQAEAVSLHVSAGKIVQGLTDAPTQLTLDENLFRKIFFEFDTTAAMTGVMFGKIKIDGDMSQLMALQMAKPSPEQKALFKQIIEISE